MYFNPNDDSKEDADEYEFLVHDVLLFNSKTDSNLENRLKIGKKIISKFNQKISESNIRNVSFAIIQLYSLDDIITMYSNFKYFGASNGPTAWHSSFKTNPFDRKKAVRGGILVNDTNMNSKCCRTMKCNGIAIVNINNSSSIWINQQTNDTLDKYALIGLTTNENTNVMLMATNMDNGSKSLLYDLDRTKVVGFTTIAKNALQWNKDYILVDSCVKQIYLDLISDNKLIANNEKGISIEYFVSYLPDRMGFDYNHYMEQKDALVYEIDVIQWYLNLTKYLTSSNL